MLGHFTSSKERVIAPGKIWTARVPYWSWAVDKIRATLKDPTYRQKYRQFLRRLRQARHEASLTQVDVAKKLRRPQSFVSKCESGVRRVDAIELAEFAALTQT